MKMRTNWKPQAKPTAQTLPKSKHKVIFLGDQSVGKSSLINRTALNRFDPNIQPTVGIDFISQEFHLQNQIVRLQLWDTAGQSRFASLIPSYIKGSSAIILIYDVTNPNSFKDIRIWQNLARQSAKQDVLIYLVANKIDLPIRAVQTSEGLEYARTHNIAFIEVSCKTGQNIESLFNHIAHLLSKTPVTAPQNPGPPGISLENPQPVTSRLYCCS